MKLSKKYTLEEIAGMFTVFGMDLYHCEEMSLFEHSAQMAILAKTNGFSEEVQIAAFLHQIGDMLPENCESDGRALFGLKNKEKVAAGWLKARGFSEMVVFLVEYHLHAKRYLMFRDPTSHNFIADAGYPGFNSRLMPMNEVEADAFDQLPYFELNIAMRKWGETSKVIDLAIPDMEHFLQMIERHLERKAIVF